MTESEPSPSGSQASFGGVEVLLVSGMSGAGRTTVANVLEDLGWYVVDNLPPQMLAPLVEIVGRADGAVPKLAVVVDVRGQTLFREIADSLEAYWDQGITFHVLFLDASDEALVRRFESVRRPHPLQGEGSILDGIRSERDAVSAIRARAGTVIDTSGFNVHDLSSEVKQIFGDEAARELKITIMSFGFKYGLPVDADHVADVRFLPNPYWIPALRGHTGKDPEVSDFVLSQSGALTFVDRYAQTFSPIFDGYARENRSHATIAIGCTGGKHRSVAISIELAKRLSERSGVRVSVRHRDLGRE